MVIHVRNKGISPYKTTQWYEATVPSRITLKIEKYFTRYNICPIICLYVLSSVLWCPLRFPYKNYVWFVFTQLFIGRLVSYFCYLYLFAHSHIKYLYTTWVTWRVSYKRQKLLALRKHLGSPSDFGGVCVAHRFSFLCRVFVLSVFVLCLVYPMLPVPLDCPFLISPFVFLWLLCHKFEIYLMTISLSSICFLWENVIQESLLSKESNLAIKRTKCILHFMWQLITHFKNDNLNIRIV